MVCMCGNGGARSCPDVINQHVPNESLPLELSINGGGDHIVQIDVMGVANDCRMGGGMWRGAGERMTHAQCCITDVTQPCHVHT